MKFPIGVFRTLLLFWAGILSFRLLYWQVYKSPQLTAAAQAQYGTSAFLPAARGEILSQDGYPLVTNDQRFIMYAVSGQFKPTQRILNDLRIALNATSSSFFNPVRFTDIPLNSWIILARDLPLTAKEALERLNLTGLNFESEPVRSYPESSSSAYLTGFVGKDGSGQPQGYFGLEGFYDRTLTGKPGRIIQERDALNQPIVIGGLVSFPSQPGKSIQTSIDRTVQHIAARSLEAGLTKYQAAAGSVVILESATGKVLSMVSLPGYDPKSYRSYSPDLYKNPIISVGYEPGSTFKTIVMASALDAGVVTPETVCNICTGPAILSGKAVKSYNDKYYPDSTMTEVILHSDNVGMVFVAQKMGKTRLLDYLRRFGFGRITGIDLQEEDSPPLRPDDQWREIDWGTIAFGQGIAVTRLQMVVGVNTIAMGGMYLPPKVATHQISHGQVTPLPTSRPERIISRQAAAQMTQMMINGVENGEVRYYKPPGFLIAGKTGTAQIPIEGHYDPDQTIASFVGFAPADNPKFTMLVSLTNPQTSPWGSTTAAPVWFDIATDLFRYFKIAPQVKMNS